MGLSWQHLLIVLVIVLIFFGPGRLPEVFKKAGEGMKAFRDASQGGPDSPTNRAPSSARTTEVVEDDDDEYEEVVVRRKKKKPAPQLTGDALDDAPQSVAKGTSARSEG